jgi:PAP2 superfamily
MESAMYSRFSIARQSRRSAAALIAAALLAAASLAQAADRPDRRTTAPAWCADRCDELVIDWNATAYQVIKASDGYRDPLHASRALAMMHLAMHDAVNAARPRYASYASSEHDAAADPAIAAVSAAHDVLAALYPKQQDTLLKAALDKSMSDAGLGADVVRGAALGKRVAAVVLQRRAADGSAASEVYEPGSKPGQYRFTPGFELVAHPHWRSVQPFALSTPGQFRTAPPPSLQSNAYTVAFNEVKSVGGKGADAKRTPDDTNLAVFWYEFSDIGWNRIARVVARNHRQDLWQRARTFALLNAAMADAYIAGWDSKMHHDFWRPVTAIRAADTDGNPNTTADAGFTPLMVSPPVQDHPSTHSALGAAAATVLAHAFGRDQLKFTVSSTSALAANPTREFKSFSEAARENADSRVKAGIHFRFATEEGLKLGRNIGRHTVQTLLMPQD